MAKKKNSIKQRPKKTGRGVAERPHERKSVDSMPPHFSFANLQRSHCIQECTKDERSALADTLRLLSSMTWGELRQAPYKGRGYEKIERYSFTVHVPDSITEDVDLLAFRFCGKAPIVGYRVDRVFHVVWVDRAFDVYNHG